MGSLEHVLKTIRTIKGVKEAHGVFGVYDVIAKVEAESMSEIKNVVLKQIRRLNQIESSQTMIVIPLLKSPNKIE